MKLSQLRNLRILVWGGGREGVSAAQILQQQQCTIAFVSDTPDTDSATRDASHTFAAQVLHPTEIASWSPDFIVRSPGVSRYREELQPYPSSSVFALWLADQDPRRIIGVTGTKGKSTTATLIAHILRAAGHTIELAGNIGRPVTECSPHADFVIVEVSSYQASDCTTSPGIGVLTSLGEDHIPWHGDVPTYHRDKLNLFVYSELRHMVYHASDQLVTHEMSQRNLVDKRFSNSQHSVNVALATPQGEKAIERMGNTTFPKNLELAMDAALAADNSLTLANVLDALDTTEPLPSRQNTVAHLNERVFVDDALASNPLGAIAAIERFDSRPFVLIMGGEDRHVDYTPLYNSINATQNLRHIVVLGDHSHRLYAELLATKVPISTAASHNVAHAVQVAFHVSCPGDIIVFSPGAPTPKEIGDYLVRSGQFLAGIAELPPA